MTEAEKIQEMEAKVSSIRNCVDDLLSRAYRLTDDIDCNQLSPEFQNKLADAVIKLMQAQSPWVTVDGISATHSRAAVTIEGDVK